MALTGEQDTLQTDQTQSKDIVTEAANLNGFFEEPFFNGLCRVHITRLIPHPKKPGSKE